MSFMTSLLFQKQLFKAFPTLLNVLPTIPWFPTKKMLDIIFFDLSACNILYVFFKCYFTLDSTPLSSPYLLLLDQKKIMFNLVHF